VVQSGDTCDAIDSLYSITLSQFLMWNPAVNAACTNIQAGLAYCVRVYVGTEEITSYDTASSTTSSLSSSSSSSSTASATATATVSPPGPTASGTNASCHKYYIDKTGKKFFYRGRIILTSS